MVLVGDQAWQVHMAVEDVSYFQIDVKSDTVHGGADRRDTVLLIL